MISGREIANGIGAAFAIAKGEEGWEERFDMSAEQVFRSGWAIPLAIPAMLLGLEAKRRIAFAEPATDAAQIIAAMTPLTYYISQSLVFLLVWAAEIGLLIAIAQRREMGWKISPMIIGANWAKFLFVIASGLITGAAILTGALGFAAIGGMIAYGVLFYLRWGIIRRTLDMSPLRTAGMLAVLAMASVAVSTIVSLAMVLLGLVELEVPTA